MTDPNLAQPGVLNDALAFAEYLTFVLRDDADASDGFAHALEMVDNAARSIGHKDVTAQVSATIGVSARAWPRLFPGHPLPEGLADFEELRDGDRHFPATPGDVFVMVKSTRIDLNLQVAKYVYDGLRPIADLTEDVTGFRYLDDRDLIDFVDGTENPIGPERTAAVLVPDGPYAGGSHLFVQRYVDRQADWDALSTEQQQDVIGRTKFDDLELPAEQKKPYAHNVRSKVERDGEELAMYRQNRAFGTALEHGTMFIGFVQDPTVIRTSLRQMIVADEHGAYDHLLDFVVARTGTAYFVPPVAMIAPGG
ncbi:MAG: Dyp-type peroxidase [Actinomycetales bacterium]